MCGVFENGRLAAQLAAAHAAARQEEGVVAGGYADRVEMSGLSIYWIVIHRYGELFYGAKKAGETRAIPHGPDAVVILTRVPARRCDR